MTRRTVQTSTRLVLAAALTIAGLVATSSTPVAADPTTQAPGRVRGAILARGGTPKVDVLWFTVDWTYLGRVTALGGGYTLTLPPGTYRLQFVDRAPAYDVDRLAPTDTAVTVTEAATTIRDVTLRRGGALGGVVRAGGKPAAGARVVAANTDEQSFETTADKTGSFALGGLPDGKYSVFTYDRKRSWVGRSVYVGKVKRGSFHTVEPVLTKRAGSLIVDLYAGAEAATQEVYLTAVSRKTGQFWTVRASGGTATFRGLYPGTYTIKAPAYPGFAAQTAPVEGGDVRAGRAAFGSFRWTVPG